MGDNLPVSGPDNRLKYRRQGATEPVGQNTSIGKTAQMLARIALNRNTAKQFA